ncbi:MAG TPA: CARDB domain-containing protein, partial [Vicinamibacteria bacterium]
IAAEGPRVPSASDSPKKFRAAFLVVTRPGVRPTDELLAAVHQVRDGFQTRFSILTGGRAVAQVYPEALVDGTVGTPDGVEGGTLRDDASLADGFTWLRNQQRTEGFWEDTEATRLRDTTISLETLLRFDGSFAGSPSAIDWLGSQEDRSVDFLARRAATLERLGVDAADARAKLLALQNPDGGFGIAFGYGSDPLDTALAILALVDRSLVPGAAVDRAVGYLLGNRNADGGWGQLNHGASRTRATLTVVRALSAAARLDATSDTALAWLASRQNGDGGFGDSPSTVHDTADVLQVFADLEQTSRIHSEEAYLFLRSQQSLDGSWNGSTFATALALTTLQGGRFPNLRFGAPIIAVPASPRDGERVELQLSVVNDGGSPSLPVLLRLFEGDPDAGGLPLPGDVEIPALAAKRSATVRVTWDSFDKPGLRKIFAVLDAESAVLELNELDNKSSIEIEVQPAPDGTDLEIRSGDIAIVPIAPDRLPTTLAISAGLRNLGRTGVDAARVRLWLGPAGTGTLVDEQTTPILERSTRVVNFSHALSVPGTSLFTIEADPEDELPEANEENNVATSSVTTTPSVDLEVTNSDLSLSSGTLFLGNDVTFRARIRNAGTVDAPPAIVRFSITDGTTSDLLATRTAVLAAGENVEQTLDYRIDRVGALR